MKIDNNIETGRSGTTYNVFLWINN